MDSKMKLLILLCTIVLVRATPIPKSCKGVRIANSPILYERELVTSNLDSPFMFTVDYSNILYFSHYILNDALSITAKVDLNNKEFKNITTVPNGCATAIDSKNNEVYIGSGNGIYKYDPKTDTAELYAANNTNVRSVYFHDYLYYTIDDLDLLYVIKNGEDVKATDIEETNVIFFVIDKDDDIFYTNDTGIYGQKKGTKDAELYEQFGDLTATFLTTDNNGIVYTGMHDGIFVVNKDAKRFDKILDLQYPQGLAFDKQNNIIYSDFFNIYILKPNKNLIY